MIHKLDYKEFNLNHNHEHNLSVDLASIALMTAGSLMYVLVHVSGSHCILSSLHHLNPRLGFVRITAIEVPLIRPSESVIRICSYYVQLLKFL
ncbi:hypothetical protein ACET3Z_015393 [Daucus carota]